MNLNRRSGKYFNLPIAPTVLIHYELCNLVIALFCVVSSSYFACQSPFCSYQEYQLRMYHDRSKVVSFIYIVVSVPHLMCVHTMHVPKAALQVLSWARD